MADIGFEATTAGQFALRMARVRRLVVGSQRLQNMTVALTAGDPPERIGDGLLPTALFKSLYVNNHEGFVVFNPRPRKR